MAFDITPEQLRRAQINGAAARILPTKNYNGFGVRADHSEKILKLLKDGERSITDIAACLHLQYFNTHKQLARLLDAGQVEQSANGRKGKFFRLAGVQAASTKPQRYQYEFRELHRDLRAHQRLAEMVHK